MSSNQTNNIYSKSCGYGCGLQIYWNTSENTYFEVFSQKKHSCPNRVNKQSIPNAISNNVVGTATTTSTKPTYYSKKPWNSNQQPKPKMSNSFEYLQGSITDIQKKYEILSDIVIVEHGGKVHGSQRDLDPNIGLIDLLVYYEVPLGQRDEVQRKFDKFVSISIKNILK